ncbi:SGNH/GDSL hydrolase family protein [Rubritalea marina]|uniref:SGNH/GDSL hydrolase family protein n=1 Tax=Rubritalea marina TaxID=361055 RepID=UPI000376FEF0|nr:SGNH/GDSL hydrolase family protein [Rubritalea marina]
MLDRRSFLTRSVVAAGAAALGSSAKAAPSKTSIGLVAGSRLLFQGDSITDMQWGRNQRDRNHYLGHSYVFLLAARLGVDMPEAKLEFYNRGISGNTTQDLKKRWQKDAIDIKPDLLSILIGTNDVGKGITPQEFEANYRQLLDASLAANSQLRLVMLDPFVLRSGGLKSEQAWKARRSATDKLGAIVDKLAADYNAVHIQTQAIFDAATELAPPEHWIWDGIHPLPQGHELIARSWLEALCPLSQKS